MGTRCLTIFLTIFLFISSKLVWAQQKQFVLSLTDQAKYSASFTHFNYVNPAAPQGGKIRIGTVGSFDSFNPFILQGIAPQGLELIYDSLLAKSQDEIASYYPLLAEYFIIDEQAKKVTFKINDAARWHDASKLTNQDVLFSFNMLKEQGHPYYKIMLGNFSKAELEQNNKISFYFKEQVNYDLLAKLATIAIFSQQYYKQHEFTKTSLEKPLASGPYQIAEFKAPRNISYIRNHDYWANNLNVNQGRYNFREVSYHYYRDANSAILGLKADEYDLRFENIAKNWSNAYVQEAGKNLVKEKIKHQIPTGMQAFAFNLRKSKFQDELVRKALNYAFDFNWTNRNLFYSSYERTESFFSNSPYQADTKLSKKERDFLGGDLEQYRDLVKPISTDGSGNNRANLKKAMQLLEQAGWQIKDFELTNAGGEVFNIEFLITSPSFQRVILPYIKNLRKLGIEAEIRMVDFSQYQQRLQNFDFDVVVTVYPGVNIPGNEQLNFWHSKYANVPGSRNIIAVENPLIDEILENLAAAETYNDKKFYAKLLDRVLRKHYYVVPQWNLGSFRIVYWRDRFSMPDVRPIYELGIDSWWAISQ